VEHPESMARPWSSMQFYGLAVTCLLVGICIGYWVRASVQAGAVTLQAAKPAVAHASAMQSTPDPMKQEADKLAEPLLARLQNSHDDPLLPAEIGKIYYQMRQFSIAAKYYEHSVRIKPDAIVLVKLGGAYHFEGDEDKAIGAWNQALRLDPNNPDALYNIGFVKWYVQGDREAAMAAFQKLLKTNLTHPKRTQVEKLLNQVKQHPETPRARKE
jgi:cytochrome c-type biogenesis protein CcmH/NrfG